MEDDFERRPMYIVRVAVPDPPDRSSFRVFRSVEDAEVEIPVPVTAVPRGPDPGGKRAIATATEIVLTDLRQRGLSPAVVATRMHVYVNDALIGAD